MKPNLISFRNIIISCLVFLTGCSVTSPVTGVMGKEQFLGHTTGYLSGNGDLSIDTIKGVHCTGEWAFDVRTVNGKGIFICNDGRHGTFYFTSDGQRGKGFGKTTTGEPFRFTFGYADVVYEKY